MIDIKNFEDYINNTNYIYAKKRGLIHAFKRIQLWESASNTSVDKWNLNMLVNFCKNGIDIKDVKRPANMEVVDFIRICKKLPTTSYFGLYTSINYINDVLKILGREDLHLSVSDFDVDEIGKKTDLFTKQEIIDICDALANAQDKFIIYALFSGIRGNKYSDLVNLKVNDINFDTKEIKLPSGKVIIMDDYLEDILRDITDKEFGAYYYKLNRSGYYDINSLYKLNMDSEFVVKVKPTVTNNNGLGCFSFQGLQTRLKGLSKVLNMNLLGVNIYRSGVISRMNESKDSWNQTEILNYLKENECKLTAYETKKAYEEVYGKKKII